MKVQIKACTASGEEHGLMGTLPNSVPFDDFKAMSPENKEKCRKELAHKKKIVKARYINYQSQNDRLEKPYCVGAGEPIQLWKFIPNYTYDLPLGLVEEVNSAYTVQRADLVSVDGADMNRDASPTTKDKEIRIHEFVPISF